MNDDFVFLAEKEAMWAEMLEQVLKDHSILYVAIPVYGAGLTLKTGVQERFKIFVQMNSKAKAEALLMELFPNDCMQ